MKKWFHWLVLSLIWALAAVANFLHGDTYWMNIIQFSIFLILGLCQLFCDRAGEKGRKTMTWILRIGLTLCAAVFLVAIVLVIKSRP